MVRFSRDVVGGLRDSVMVRFSKAAVGGVRKSIEIMNDFLNPKIVRSPVYIEGQGY